MKLHHNSQQQQQQQKVNDKHFTTLYINTLSVTIV